jgi:phosphoesterase family protein
MSGSWRGFGMGSPLAAAAVAFVAVLAFALVPSGAAGTGAGSHVSTLRPAVVPPPTPYIQHIVIIPLENEVLTEVWGHGPYERYLAAHYGNASSYYAACHPSAPNYLAMFAAVVNQCGTDAWNNYTNKTIAIELDAAHLTWGSYAEGLTAKACSNPGGATSGLYATKHVPALFFKSVLRNQTYCHAHVMGSVSFNNSVANGTLRNYSFYTPNLCDDGHNGCGGNTSFGQLTAQADVWLKDWLSPMLNHTGRFSSAKEQAMINHTAFIVTWDEGLGSNAGFAVAGITGGDNYLWCGQNGASGDAVCGSHIYTAVVSPYSLHRSFATKDSAYGLVNTVEWLYHLRHLGNPGQLDNQTGFPPMKSLFNFTANG